MPKAYPEELRSAFAQLGSFLTYKAARHGVLLLQVNAAYTGQQCSACGHIDRKNRPNKAEFCCRRCGFSLGADRNASINISRRATTSLRLQPTSRTRPDRQKLELQARSFRVE